MRYPYCLFIGFGKRIEGVMTKHKYLIAVACQQKISSMMVAKDHHVFPYTDEVMNDMRTACIQHTKDKYTFLLSITYLGEFME